MMKEFSAKNVDEAITKACLELGISSDQLEIEVVSEGSSGFLGFGSKPAVIRVRKKEEAPVKEEKEEPSLQPVPSKEEASSPDTEETAAPSEEKPVKKQGKVSHSHEEFVPVERTEEETEQIQASARAFLEQLFAAMELPVDIEITYDAGTDSLDINFAGEEMGILIGKRGQTLDSLQYLVSLVVNKELKHYIRVKLDTEDYRRRRKETLENLAFNIARKVKKTRKPVSLEPMNPYERRIIHSVLQNHHQVETYSEGNEPYRHVVIALKK